MPAEEKLLPCPACGGINLRIRCNPIHKNWNAMSAVSCDDCYTQGATVSGDDAAIKAWNALPRALRWTKEPPAKEGWYWVKFDKGEVRMLEIRRSWLKTMQKIAEWEWCGPIPEPKEK